MLTENVKMLTNKILYKYRFTNFWWTKSMINSNEPKTLKTFKFKKILLANNLELTDVCTIVFRRYLEESSLESVVTSFCSKPY